MLILACTSLMFIIPSVVAMKRKQHAAGRACGLLTVTSIMYHGIGQHWMKVLDVSLAHSLVILYTIKGIMLYRKTKKEIYAIGCCNSIAAATLYLVNENVVQHPPLHIFVQYIGLCSMMCYLSAS